MQNHIWVIQAYYEEQGGWHHYMVADTRAEARLYQKYTTRPTRIRKFIAA